MWNTPSGAQKESSDKYIEGITKQPEDYRVLQRVPLDADKIPIKLAESHDTDTTIVIVDVETTGIGSDDKIIELGMIRCRFDNKGQLAGIDKIFDMFEDPKEPLSPIVTKLTGITDDMLKDKQIDRDEALDMIQDDPIMVAHNARFDRPRFEKIFPNDLRWRCTLNNIPWNDIGYGSRSLEALLMYEGWFFDPHRAYRDCLATAWLLHCVKGSLEFMLEPTVKIVVRGDTFPIKENLKSRGYRWDNPNKTWWIIQPANNTELEYLTDLYSDGIMASEEPIDPRQEYK